MADRPTVAEYQPADAPAEEQELIHRPMNDEELADYLEREAAAADREERPANPIIAAVEQMDEGELAALRELLDR